jgi:hypothetical protein
VADDQLPELARARKFPAGYREPQAKQAMQPAPSLKVGVLPFTPGRRLNQDGPGPATVTGNFC